MTRRRKRRGLPWHKGGHRKRVPLCDRKVAGQFAEQVFGSGTILGIDRATDGSGYAVTVALPWNQPVYVRQMTLP